MARHFDLLIVAGCILALTFMSPVNSASAASSRGCSTIDYKTGVCGSSATNEVNSTYVRADKGEAEPGIKGIRETTRTATSAPKVLTSSEIQNLLDSTCYGDGTCGGNRAPGALNPLIPTIDVVPGRPEVPLRAVTIADVARFLPAQGALHSEPDGWAVVGVPANFWAKVEPVVVTGELLGDTAQVRFTPRLYTFDYGDGTTRTSTDPGSSWQELGQEELSTTPTSHLYRERGRRAAAATIAYTAEYRVGGGDWIAVAGAVTARTPATDLLVVAERTVLTAGEPR